MIVVELSQQPAPSPSPFHLGNEGGSSVGDISPRSCPTFGQTNVTAPRKTRQMPGHGYWRKPDMGAPLMDN